MTIAAMLADRDGRLADEGYSSMFKSSTWRQA